MIDPLTGTPHDASRIGPALLDAPGYLLEPLAATPAAAVLTVVLLLATTWVFSGRIVGVVVGRSAAPSGDRTGWAIGKAENALVMFFCLADELTGLAVIVAAKAIVRRGRREDTSYRVAGTLVNLAWSVCIGLIARCVIFGVARV